MYDLIVGIGESFVKHGMSLSALGMALFVLLKQRKVKRLIRKRLPWLLRDDADVVNYEARQIRIENDVRAIKEHLGVKGWDADSQIGRTAHSVTTGQRKKLSLQRAAYVLVTFTRFFTPSKATYPSQQRRMNMKSKLLSRKLWMTILGSVVLVLNQQLGWHLNTESIIGIGSLIMSFIFGQSLVDTNGVGQFAPFLEKLKSSKLWVSLIGSALIIINDEYKLGFTADHIYMLVGIGVTFILGKSTASVVQASKKAEVKDADFETPIDTRP